MPENFFDRERAAVVQLTDAVRARAAAEVELAAAHEAAVERAEREVARARKSNATARDGELGRIDEMHEAAVGAVERKYDAEQFSADRAREDRRVQLGDKFRTAELKGRTEYNDRLWHIDSMLEAGEKAAKEQLEALQRKAAGGTERVKTLWAEAEPALARGRVARAGVEYTGELPTPTDDDPISRMNKAVQASEDALDRLARLHSPRWSGPRGIVLCALLAGGLGAVSFAFLDLTTAVIVTGATGVILGLALWALVRWFGRHATLAQGKVLGRNLAEAARACRLLNDYAAWEYAEERARLTERHARKKKETNEHYLPQFDAQKKQYDAELVRIETEHAAQTEKTGRQRAAETKAERETYESQRAKIERRLDVELKAAEESFAEKMAAATSARDAAWAKMAAAWMEAVGAVSRTFDTLRAEGRALFPPWDEVLRDDRPLADRVPDGVRCGDFLVNLKAIPDGVPADARLAAPEELSGPVPAFLPFPDRCSVLLRARDDGRAAAVTALQAMMLRFLTGLPPGKVRFTIIDPVGLGENFAAFMHLADHDEKLVTSQIWTEPAHIEQRLTDLTDHIASVIQKYLRNQYKTIEDYNRAAGEVAEPYRVLVVANFPAGFSPEAAKRLISIASSGPSCGVCTLVSADTRATMPRDFNINDLEAVSFTVAWKENSFPPKDPALAPFPLVLDRPPDTTAIAKLVHRVGKGSRDAARVEVPFEYIAPKPEDVWKGDASRGFEVPVGRAGATRRQSISLGRGTAQHAVVAGKTGSGKSTLLHALITNLSLTYSPDEAELYLIDFKEGVEFQWYATYRLPHARVVAIESEREFGLSVLQRLDGVLKERGDKFREAEVNDLASYRAARPKEKIPRILLIIDEFQQLFVEDDKLAQEAALLLDRLVRQGRAFGMHVLLGSQTLGGAYSLPRSTIDQMAVRVALQCSDTDAQLILSKDNTAARLLSRPGEAIYNDQNGLVEGNDPFQVVWLAEEKRERLLSDLHKRAGEKWPPPLVFAGNTHADVENNHALARLLATPAVAKAPAAWLGEPVAIKDPTAAVFRPLGGANLLVIGQNEEAARGLFTAAVVGLAAQLPVPSPRWGEGGEPSKTAKQAQPPNGEPGEGKRTKDPSPPTPLPNGERGATFTILDGTPDDSDEAEYLSKFAAKVPGAVAPPRSGIAPAVAELAAEMDRRHKGESKDRTPRFLFVFGVHRFRDLRKAEEDFGFGRRGAEREPTPGERFAALLRDGPAVGIHVVVWCDSVTNLNRTFDRPQLREFAQRVLFQMSATDSSTLMDSPAASKLGRTRALYLTEETERPEKFRPYGVPTPEWLDAACEKLRARVGLKPKPAGV
jgi:DNA segregation ATPase FtsK/SpoIIIE-like protein